MSDGACALTEADRLVPLTAAQQGIWAGQRLDPGSPVYFAAEFVELAGKLDVARLAAAIRAVMAKAPALHARFSEVDGEPAQRLAVTDDWALPVLDLGGEAAAVEWMRSRLATSPDLARGPLFEHAVLRVGPQRHFWYLRMHHILADGYAFALLIRSVADAYSGRPVRLGDLAPVLAEDLAYQRDPDMAADRDFWLRYLDGSPDPVTLAAGTAHVSSPIRVRVPLPEPPEGHDPTAGPIAAVAALLDREEVVLGLPVMGRFGSAALRVPCMLMNIVPLRVRDTSPEAVSRELELIRPHSRYRYERLRRDLGLVGGERRLFGPVVNLLPFGATPRFDGLTARVHQLSAGPVEDISFAFGKDLVIDANPGLYTVDDLKAHAATLTDLLASGPHRRRHTVLDGGPVPPTAPVLDLIARHDPDRPAVGTTTYGELNRAVSHLADKLTRAGAKPGAIIAVKLPRGVNAVIAALAVLRTGAAYLPLDPAAPPAREAAILADARPTAIIQPHPTTPHDTDKVQPHATTPQHDTQESRPPAVTARHDPTAGRAQPDPVPAQRPDEPANRVRA